MTREQADHFTAIGLSVRTCGVLQSRGLDTPEAIRALSDLDLLRKPGIGRVTLDELRRAGLRPDVPSRAVVSAPDLGILLLHSLRYSLGRRSSAPSTTADLIRRHWRDTDDAHRALLLRDLHEEIARAWRCGEPRWLGDECDVREWHRLLAWMTAPERAQGGTP